MSGLIGKKIGKNYDVCAASVNNHIYVAAVPTGKAPRPVDVANKKPEDIVDIIVTTALPLSETESALRMMGERKALKVEIRT